MSRIPRNNLISKFSTLLDNVFYAFHNFSNPIILSILHCVTYQAADSKVACILWHGLAARKEYICIVNAVLAMQVLYSILKLLTKPLRERMNLVILGSVLLITVNSVGTSYLKKPLH